MSKVTKKDLQYQINGLAAEASIRHNSIMRIHRALASIGVDIFSDDFDLTEPEPQLKQLDQSVFDGLDEKWRFAARCLSGKVIVTECEPKIILNGYYCEDGYLLVGTGYDASNWQNSLIERDTAKELLEVDLSSELTGSELCKAMLARGDKCVLIRMGVRDDKQAKDIGRFAIATSIDESGRFNVMSDQQPISKVDFAVPISNQGEPLTAAEAGL